MGALQPKLFSVTLVFYGYELVFYGYELLFYGYELFQCKKPQELKFLKTPAFSGNELSIGVEKKKKHSRF